MEDEVIADLHEEEAVEEEVAVEAEEAIAEPEEA